MCSTDKQRAILVNGACDHRAAELLRHWHGLTCSHKATAGQQQKIGAETGANTDVLAENTTQKMTNGNLTLTSDLLIF